MESDENKRGRVRKKSAKVREMEEFEEEERKSNKKPAPATPPMPVRKGSNKPSAPVVTPSSTQKAEATVVSPPTVGKTVTTPPPKTPPTPDSDPQGKGSVIKLLLSSPVQPSTPASGKQGKKGGGDVAKNPVAVESGSKKASKSKKRADGEHDGKKKLTALSVDTTVHSEPIGEEGSLKMKFILSPKDKTLDSNSSKKGASVEKTSNQGLINMLKSDSTPAPVEGKKGRRSKSTEEEKSGENLVKSPVEKKKKSMSNWIKQIGVKRKVDDPPPASATVTQTEEEAKKPKPEEPPKIKEEVESPPPKKSKPEKVVIKQERLDEEEEGQAEETVIVSKKGKSKEIAYVAEIVKAEPESDLENVEESPPLKKKEIVSPSGKRKLEHPSGNKKKLEKALGLSRKMEQTVVIKTNPSSSIEYQLPADQSIEDMDLSSFDFDEAGDLVIAEENKTKKLKKSAPKSPKKIKTSAIKTEKDEHSMDVSTMGSGDVAVLAKRVKTAAERKMRKRLKKVKVVQPEKPKLKKKRAPTAYMLWCNTQRQKVVTENPGADFVTISRRLGELWQCLTDKEKLSWKNKAKKSAGKGSTLISTGKSGGSRTGPPPQVTAQSSHNAPASAPTVIKVPTHAVKQRPPPEDPLSPIKGFGTEPVDVAAHLKLVGESLCIIGVRLQEHRGLIAVQGSLSVLLDSMLCACGPLMCLTQKLPEMDGCNSEVHARTLDNVAYIMPGL